MDLKSARELAKRSREPSERIDHAQPSPIIKVLTPAQRFANLITSFDTLFGQSAGEIIGNRASLEVKIPETIVGKTADGLRLIIKKGVRMGDRAGEPFSISVEWHRQEAGESEPPISTEYVLDSPCSSLGQLALAEESISVAQEYASQQPDM